jgi:AraC-like DNA-binding protein
VYQLDSSENAFLISSNDFKMPLLSSNPYLLEINDQFLIKYMQNPNLRLEEIAFLVGYSGYSTFSRPFKQWTGCAPKEYQA